MRVLDGCLRESDTHRHMHKHVNTAHACGHGQDEQHAHGTFTHTHTHTHTHTQEMLGDKIKMIGMRAACRQKALPHSALDIAKHLLPLLREQAADLAKHIDKVNKTTLYK